LNIVSSNQVSNIPFFKSIFKICEDWSKLKDDGDEGENKNKKNNDEMLYEPQCYDYLKNPYDYGEYNDCEYGEQYNNIQGLTKCRNCYVFHFLANTSCASSIEHKVIECICCRYELPETKFPFVANEKLEKKSGEKQRENICSECQPHKNKSHCCIMKLWGCGCANPNTSDDNDGDNVDDVNKWDDDFCYDCNRPHERCMCDYWAARCDEDELNDSYYDDICDDCGSMFCHCYASHQY
jgi:hypothetical protein